MSRLESSDLPDRKSHLPLLVVILAVLTCVRLAGLTLSVVDLFDDEAQYWSWGARPCFRILHKTAAARLAARLDFARVRRRRMVRALARTDPLFRNQPHRLLCRAQFLRRANRILGRSADGVDDRGGFFGARDVDGRPVAVFLDVRAAGVQSSAQEDRQGLGGGTGHFDRPGLAVEIRDDLLHSGNVSRGAGQSLRARSAEDILDVASDGDRSDRGCAERDLERAERFRNISSHRKPGSGRTVQAQHRQDFANSYRRNSGSSGPWCSRR